MHQYFNVTVTFPGGEDHELPIAAGDVVRSYRRPTDIAAREGFTFVKETGNSWNPHGFVPTIFLEPVSEETRQSIDRRENQVLKYPLERTTAVTQPLMLHSEDDSDESDILEYTELPFSEDNLSIVSSHSLMIPGVRYYLNDRPHLPGNGVSVPVVTDSESSSAEEQAPRFIIQTASALAVQTNTPFNKYLDVDIDKLDCPVCFDTISPDKLLFFLCQNKSKSSHEHHYICEDCYRSYIFAALNENTTAIGCFTKSPTCTWRLGYKVIDQLFDSDFAKEYTLKIREIQELTNADTRFCPAPDCSYRTKVKKGTKKLKCADCNTEFCGSCRRLWAGNHKKGTHSCKGNVGIEELGLGSSEPRARARLSFQESFRPWKWAESDQERHKAVQYLTSFPWFVKLFYLPLLLLLTVILEIFSLIVGVVVACGLILLIPVFAFAMPCLYGDVRYKSNPITKGFCGCFSGILFLPLFILIQIGLAVTAIIVAVFLPPLLCLCLVPFFYITISFGPDVSTGDRPKACPRCSTLISRESGCNHMTCWNCRFEFCWVCMVKWTRCGANYTHLINRGVLDNALAGWKFWNLSEVFEHRGYRNWPQKQKLLVEFCLMVSAPIILVTLIPLASVVPLVVLVTHWIELSETRKKKQLVKYLLMCSCAAVIGIPVALVVAAIVVAVGFVLLYIVSFLDVILDLLCASGRACWKFMSRCSASENSEV